MPSTVTAHLSHSARGKPERVRTFIRMGPEHSKEWKRMVAAIKRELDRNGWKPSPHHSPEALATARLGAKSWSPAERRKLAREGRL